MMIPLGSVGLSQVSNRKVYCMPSSLGLAKFSGALGTGRGRGEEEEGEEEEEEGGEGET